MATHHLFCMGAATRSSADLGLVGRGVGRRRLRPDQLLVLVELVVLASPGGAVAVHDVHRATERRVFHLDAFSCVSDGAQDGVLS